MHILQRASLLFWENAQLFATKKKKNVENGKIMNTFPMQRKSGKLLFTVNGTKSEIYSFV